MLWPLQKRNIKMMPSESRKVTCAYYICSKIIWIYVMQACYSNKAIFRAAEISHGNKVLWFLSQIHNLFFAFSSVVFLQNSRKGSLQYSDLLEKRLERIILIWRNCKKENGWSVSHAAIAVQIQQSTCSYFAASSSILLLCILCN